MKRVQLVHRGHVTAEGFLIDVPLLGEREARSRVMAIMEPGDRLLMVPEGRWLLLLGTPLTVDSAATPGVPLVRVEDVLVSAPGASGAPDVTEFRFGRLTAHAVSTLPTVDHTAWFDLGEVLTLHPLETASLADAITVAPPSPPDLRAAARVAATPPGTSEMIQELQRLAPMANGGRQQSTTGGGASRRRRDRHGSADDAAPTPSRLRSAIATRVMRSPAAGFIGRKHAQYIEELTRQFRSGQIDEALHRAIPLGGELAAALTLKLPQRRTDLRISQGGKSGTSVPYGPTVQQHLSAIYRQAAIELESQGKIDEAAFVLAELLRDAHGCVALLERHRRFDEAARLAENRQLDPGTIVRLWWLANDRKRAVAVARRHGAFAAALARLDKVDPKAGEELRVEWMADLERSGDLLGAVEVAWPKPSLHPLLVNVIPRGERLGGSVGGAIRAYAAALNATDERVAALLDLVRQNADPTGELRGFVSTFAKVPASRASADRLIATAYLRAHSLEVSDGGTKSGWWWKIRGRADTALVADLPSGKHDPSDQSQALSLPHLLPGQLTVSDVAGLPSGDVLVALGPLGCRLLRRSGSVSAQWHVPTSNIVMSDHGGSALLLDRRPNGEVDIRRLDLTTRRLHDYGTMQLVSFADSFDGAQWLVIDPNNAAIVDVTESSPTIVWRPLEPGASCHSLLRTPSEVTALVSVRRDSTGGADNELRTWNPTMARLTNRRIAVFPPDVSGYQLLPNGYLTQRGANIEINLADGTDRIALGTGETAWTSGDLLVRVVTSGDDRTVRVERLLGHDEIVRQSLSPEDPIPVARSHGAIVTMWDSTGRVHVVNIERRAVCSSIRVTLD